jgi:hypothetical protein
MTQPPYGYPYPAWQPGPPPAPKTPWGLIIGLVAAGVAVVAVIGIVVVVLVAKKGPGDGSGVVDADDVGLGDCLTEIPSDAGLVSSVHTVDCTAPHKGEVFAVITVPGDDFPGQAKITGYQDRCQPALRSYSSRAMADPDVGMFVLYPTEASWQRGDRAVTCIATTDAARTGSLKN